MACDSWFTASWILRCDSLPWDIQWIFQWIFLDESHWMEVIAWKPPKKYPIRMHCQLSTNAEPYKLTSLPTKRLTIGHVMQLALLNRDIRVFFNQKFRAAQQCVTKFEQFCFHWCRAPPSRQHAPTIYYHSYRKINKKTIPNAGIHAGIRCSAPEVRHPEFRFWTVYGRWILAGNVWQVKKW